ncbi:MAG: DNA polymerase Y family protein [Brevundimonas sp.]|nr:DNA polymerase Y family protein [Brevundimonas sp.]
MTLADARAQAPDLAVQPHEPAADDALLDRMLEAFGRFSPMAALDPPHGLVLDVTGCAHLFGGEGRLLAAARSLARRGGLQARLALARTPQTARALGRFGSEGVTPEGQDRAVARRLPVAALELKPAEAQALRRAGLVVLGDLDDRPRAPLAARFGADFPTRLDRLLGLEDARITPARPPAPIVADRVLMEPLITTEPLQTVIADLLAEVEQALETRRAGAQGFRLTVFRIDGGTRVIGLGTALPIRDAAVIGRLFRERLAALTTPLDPGFGIDQLRMEALTLQRLEAVQTDLDASPRREEALQALIDRLAARLGPAAVVRVRPADSHLPERASRQLPAGRAPSDDGVEWPERDPGSPPLRPLHLFDPPQPVEVVSPVPDGPPARFTWRRVIHRVALAEGPERIEGEWWRRGGGRVRDYYRVEDAEGRRFWLFRAGHFGDEPAPRWYVHGLFA